MRPTSGSPWLPICLFRITTCQCQSDPLWIRTLLPTPPDGLITMVPCRARKIGPPHRRCGQGSQVCSVPLQRRTPVHPGAPPLISWPVRGVVSCGRTRRETVARSWTGQPLLSAKPGRACRPGPGCAFPERTCQDRTPVGAGGGTPELGRRLGGSYRGISRTVALKPSRRTRGHGSGNWVWANLFRLDLAEIVSHRGHLACAIFSEGKMKLGPGCSNTKCCCLAAIDRYRVCAQTQYIHYTFIPSRRAGGNCTDRRGAWARARHVPLPTGSPGSTLVILGTSNPGRDDHHQRAQWSLLCHGPTDCRCPPAQIDISFRHQRAPRDCQSRENLKGPLQPPPLNRHRVFALGDGNWELDAKNLGRAGGLPAATRYGRLVSARQGLAILVPPVQGNTSNLILRSAQPRRGRFPAARFNGRHKLCGSALGSCFPDPATPTPLTTPGSPSANQPPSGTQSLSCHGGRGSTTPEALTANFSPTLVAFPGWTKLPPWNPEARTHVLEKASMTTPVWNRMAANAFPGGKHCRGYIRDPRHPHLVRGMATVECYRSHFFTTWYYSPGLNRRDTAHHRCTQPGRQESKCLLPSLARGERGRGTEWRTAGYAVDLGCYLPSRAGRALTEATASSAAKNRSALPAGV